MKTRNKLLNKGLLLLLCSTPMPAFASGIAALESANSYLNRGLPEGLGKQDFFAHRTTITALAGNVFSKEVADFDNSPGDNTKVGPQKNKTPNAPFWIFGAVHDINEKFSVSLGLTGVTKSIKYSASPTNTGVTTSLTNIPVFPFIAPTFSPNSINYNTKVVTTANLFSPTFIYHHSFDKSFAISALVGVTNFKTNVINNQLDAKPFPTFNQTSGKLKKDTRYGYGTKIAGFWDVNEHFSAGAAASTPVRFTKPGKYKDVIHASQNIPATFALSTTYHMNFKTDLLFDVRHVCYRWEKIFKSIVWKNQTIFTLGAQHLLNDNLILRGGYIYGKSPIRSNGAFINYLSTNLIEHNLYLSLAYRLNDNVALIGSADYGVPKKVTDNGTGPTIPAGAGKGGILKNKRQNTLQLGARWSF